jgi:ribosomal protein S18 acetylase RimI-like enzyme
LKANLSWQIRPYNHQEDSLEIFELWRHTIGLQWPLSSEAFCRIIAYDPKSEVAPLLEVHKDQLVIEHNAKPIGFISAASAKTAELDSPEGCITLLMVSPEHQQLGAGKLLWQEILHHFRERGISKIHLGARHGAFFFPGIPANLPAATKFFGARGWICKKSVFDLVGDLRCYVATNGIAKHQSDSSEVSANGNVAPACGRPSIAMPHPAARNAASRQWSLAASGDCGDKPPRPTPSAQSAREAEAREPDRAPLKKTTLTTADKDLIAEIFKFEEMHFPNWLKYFQLVANQSGYEDILIALDEQNTIAGSLLVRDQRATWRKNGVLWDELLGDAVGGIGCVGVSESHRGQGIGLAMVARATELLKERNCNTGFIGWTTLTDWYAKLGFQPWREYLMGTFEI